MKISRICILLVLIMVITGFPEYTVSENIYNQGYTLHISDPIIIAQDESANEKGWGFFQYPKLFYSQDGTMVCQVSYRPDSSETYTGEFKYYCSGDQGQTWESCYSIDQYDMSILMNNGMYFQGSVLFDAKSSVLAEI